MPAIVSRTKTIPEGGRGPGLRSDAVNSPRELSAAHELTREVNWALKKCGQGPVAAGDPRREQVQFTTRQKSTPHFKWRRTELDLPWRELGPRSSRLRPSPTRVETVR